MTTALEKLVSISTPALRPSWNAEEAQLVLRYGTLGAELLELLTIKNGFFTFESALHVIPMGDGDMELTLAYWNAPTTWKQDYGELLTEDILFFAQDAFGNQFGITVDGVCEFYSEFAEIEPVGTSLEAWADAVLSEWRSMTGYDLAHDWQVQHGTLAEDQRLVPRIPFVLKGKYDIGNVYAGNILDAMKFRASLARQIAGLPDGTSVNIRVTEP